MNCKKCGAVLEPGWKVCPQCGKKVKSGMGGTIFALVIFFYIVFRIITIPATPSTKGALVTFENYENITTEMTYDDVCELFGETHSLKMTAAVDEYNVETYLWYSSDRRSNCTISFDENGYVTSKAAFGLEPGQAQAVVMLE